MGVPAFFKWIMLRFPKVVIDALTEDDLQYYKAKYATEKYSDTNEINLQDDEDVGDILIKKKIEENNPKIDNLYLDMNGIIHPCCHPMDKPAPKSETEMFNLIFAYIDDIISIIKPKKVLYLAIDGVAPRAKMNQQRSRRFRTAIEAQEKKEKETSLRNKWMEDGIKFTGKPTKSDDSVFDSNVITPGTEFMFNLSKALQLFIVERFHSESKWNNLQVIFSDAFVPGEGEHKILDFIRSQRV